MTALKDFYTPELVAEIGADLHRAWPAFPVEQFRAACEGMDEHELKGRAFHICRAMAETLPQAYGEAARILVASLGPRHERTEGWGMAPFKYLPHVFFVREFGLADFDLSMHAQVELTKRFTAEFSLGTFVQSDPPRAFRWLDQWIEDPNVHVRRLVSEGTRPRLPWAERLRLPDIEPVLGFLTRLVDDPEEYVRRSVANHVGDLWKDDPARAIALCRSWARPSRAPLLRHALRHAVKLGDPAALELVGAGTEADVEIAVSLPGSVAIGGKASLAVTVTAKGPPGDPPQDLLVDLAIWFARPTAPSRKVFKLGTTTLAGGESATFRKTLSFAQHSTRTHYPGEHRVEVQVNGQAYPVGSMDVRLPA